MQDQLGRGLRDLRVSVTDRCNFRCPYCMPRELFGPDHAFLPRAELLSFEEITRAVRVFVALGVTKVRLTGGEPLLRQGIPDLVRALAPLGPELTMTTNGSLLEQHAQDLKDAGLDRVTVSLDSVDPAVFQELSDTRLPLQQVLDGIAAAAAAGLPVKLNAVVRKGVNDAGVMDLVAYARDGGHELRFIEYMDVGETNGWRLDDVVPSEELRQRVAAVHPLHPRGQDGTADRWRFDDGRGEIGFVSSVSQPFCGTCTRARLTAIGELFTCLFATQGTDLRAALRDGTDDDGLAHLIAGRWAARDDRYSELRGLETPGLPRPEMSYLGG